jgi:hypothetical protein
MSSDRDPRVDPKIGDVYKYHPSDVTTHTIEDIEIVVRFRTVTPNGACSTKDYYKTWDDFKRIWKNAEVIHVAE